MHPSRFSRRPSAQRRESEEIHDEKDTGQEDRSSEGQNNGDNENLCSTSKSIHNFTTDPPYEASLNTLSPLKNPNISVDEKLELLECPFTWNMDRLLNSIRLDAEPNILLSRSFTESQEVTLLNVAVSIMVCFGWTKSRSRNTFIALDRIPQVLMKFVRSEMEGLSERAITHIVEACRCHTYASLGQMDRVAEILETIYDPHDMDANDKNTLTGIRGFCWLAYQPAYIKKGQEYILRVIEENPNCAIWHYAYGMFLRSQRRAGISTSVADTEKELQCFRNVYEKATTKKYLLLATNMICESKKYTEALDMYKKIFNSEGLNTDIYLELAAGFIAVNEKSLAEQCFDIVKDEPLQRTYYYKGRFYEKYKNYEMAKKCFEKAIRETPASAIQYTLIEDYCRLLVKIDVGRKMNVIQYFRAAIKKFNSVQTIPIQRFTLHIAFEYYYERDNIENSVIYFVKAVRILPGSPALRNYSPLRVPEKNVNVYEFLSKELFDIVENHRSEFENDTLAMCEDLREICDAHISHSAIQVMTKGPTSSALESIR